MRYTLLTLLSSLSLVFFSMAQTNPSQTTSNGEDPLLWMEEVEGERALQWVRKQNQRTLTELQADPRYSKFEAAAKKILTTQERIPYGRIRGSHVYNFWQDETHVRGLWRRTSKESYSTDSPDWEVLIDFDELAETEGKNWVFKGTSTFHDKKTDRYYTLISLSDGGKDAVVKREFSLETKEFLKDGFTTPEAKQRSTWIHHDTLLIGTDWGEGSLTESGYPRILKKWKRGSPLEEAQTILEVDPSDVSVRPFSLELEDGTILAHASEADTFFTTTYWYLPDDGSQPVKYPVPPKSEIEGVYQDHLLLSLQTDWNPSEQSDAFRSGDLIAFPIKPFLETKTLPPLELVFRPSENQAIDHVTVSKGAIILASNEDVVGKVLRIERSGSKWQRETVELPGKGQPHIIFADHDEEVVFLNYEDFLTPDSLLQYNSVEKTLQPLKSVPPKFDASGLVVKQNFTESKDGTRIPFFVIHHEDIPLDGTTPTILYSYGGFQISLQPNYSGTLGKLWLENGGAYVLANIRGGGEYGPAWHQAGLKTNRQRIYDDFIAVGEAVVSSGLTSPKHLGIMGGSNGGLLMGVMLNQRPDLWNAVVVQVPLLDMLRYHKLLAGASWVDEYGSPEIPEERAFLETISPYHNFDSEKEYPVPFFVTSTKDDRVHPAHARKLAKLFEESEKPFFYYENIDGGHSAAANQNERAKRTALEYVYLAKRLMEE